MSGVSGATSKSPSSSSGAHPSSSSNSPSSSTNKSSQPQGSKTKDSFESGSNNKSKKHVDIGGGQGSGQVSHDLKTGETKKSGGVDVAHAGASKTISTDPVVKRDDQKEIAPNTTASNHFEAGKGQVSTNASAGADDKGLHANLNVKGELDAVKDDFHVKNNTTLVNGEKPLNTENKVDGEVAVRVKGEGNLNAYLDKDGNGGAHVNAGFTAGIDGQITGSSKLSTVDDQGKPEELASGSITLHGNAGIAGAFHAGGDFKDGKLTTDFGFNLTPGFGGGVDTKVSVDFKNIAKEGQKIAEEIGKGAGDAGSQAQQQLGEVYSGIQKLFGGVHIFG
jgi:hypothetical protein